MFKKNLKTWLRASRPFSLTGSVIPVILGAVLSLKHKEFHFQYFLISIIGIIFLQTAVNLLSDHDDYENKVDTKDSYGSSGVIIENLLSSKQVYKGGLFCLTLGSFIGLYLAYERGTLILILALIGILAGYFYTGKPLMLKYKGLGAPLVFLLFGPLMVIGSYYVQMQSISGEAFFISIPVGLLTTAILHANDLRDIPHDEKAGIKTLSTLVGKNNSKNIYFAMLIFSYLSIIFMSFSGILPLWSLFCLVTLTIAYSNSKILYSPDKSNHELIILDKLTAKLQAQFGIILIFSMLLSSLI